MKILICDDHAVFRAGLKSVLAGLDASLIEADGSDEAIRRIESEPDIDLVLLDLRMPGVDGWETLRKIRSEHPTTTVVVVSASEDPKEMRAALDAGASGFLPKSTPADLLLKALQMVLAGGLYIPPEALGTVDPKPATSSSEGVSTITPRQQQVLDLMSRGLTNKEIAGVLEIAVGTVKTHVEAILAALDVSNRTEAVLAMRELGLGPKDE